MKQIRMIVLALLVSLSISVFADKVALPYTAQQIETAMRTRNFVDAETMIKSIIAIKPGSAKAWYMYSMCEEQLGHTVNARDYVTKAIALDPEEKFGSPGAPEAMLRRLTTVGGTPQTSSATTHPQVIQVIQQPPPKPTDYTGLKYVLTFAFFFSLCYLAGYFIVKRIRAKELAESNERKRKELFGIAGEFLQRVSDMIKTIKYEEKETSELSSLVTTLSASINVAITALKNKDINYNDLCVQERKLDNYEHAIGLYETRVTTKRWDAPVLSPAPIRDVSAEGQTATPNVFHSPYSDSTQVPAQHATAVTPDVYQPPTRTVIRERETVVQQPVIINNGGNNNDLLTTMLIADELSENRREREREYRQEERQEHNSSNDFSRNSAPAYEPPVRESSPAPMDFGGSNDYGSSSSSSDSGSNDSGGGDSDF